MKFFSFPINTKEHSSIHEIYLSLLDYKPSNKKHYFHVSLPISTLIKKGMEIFVVMHSNKAVHFSHRILGNISMHFNIFLRSASWKSQNESTTAHIWLCFQFLFETIKTFMGKFFFWVIVTSAADASITSIGILNS